MKDSRFIASLLRASADGFAGVAASRLCEEGTEVASGDFEAWKSQLRTQVLELATALEDEAPERFAAHLGWARDAFVSRGLSPRPLARGLDLLAEALEESLPEDARGALPQAFDLARAELARQPAPERSGLSDQDPRGRLALQYVEALRAGDESGAARLICDPVAAGSLPAEDALVDVLGPALREVGRLWHQGEMSVAEEHYISLAARRTLVRVLEVAPPAEPIGRTVVVSAVAGDAHEYGVQMVAGFFELGGWRAICLGADTPIEDLPDIVERFDADLAVLGATLDTQRQVVTNAVSTLRRQRPELRVLVGGPAFASDEASWRRTGADGRAASPAEAVALGRELVGVRSGD